MEIIKNFDASKFSITKPPGEEVTPPPTQKETPPPTNDPPPDDPEPPTPEPQANEPEPKPEPEKNEPTADPKPPEPTEPVAAEPPEPQEQEVELFDYTKDQTGGAIQTVDDILAMHQENVNLKKQLAEKPEMEFPTPQAKALYEYASKFAGNELSAAAGMLNIQQLDLGKLSAKQKQFEAFALEHKHIPREEARAVFDAKYAKLYPEGSLEDDVTLKFDHDEQTRKAEQTIQKLQQDWKNLPVSKPAADQAPEITDEDRQHFQQEAEAVMKDFGGIQYQMFENDPNSIVTIPLGKEETQKFKQYLADPQSFFNDMLSENKKEDGSLDWSKYAMSMYEFFNRQRIREQTYSSGVKYGEMKKVLELKNSSAVPKTEPPPTPQAPKTMQEAWLQAKRAQQQVA